MSPAPSTPCAPVWSRCSSPPSRTIVTVCMPRCGWSGNPSGGANQSSAIRRKGEVPGKSSGCTTSRARCDCERPAGGSARRMRSICRSMEVACPDQESTRGKRSYTREDPMFDPKCLAILALAALPAAAQDNPTARRSAASMLSLNGFWNGANLENRSHCASAGVNGIHGTYAQYLFSASASATGGGALHIHETTESNLTGDYDGGDPEDRCPPRWAGTAPV